MLKSYPVLHHSQNNQPQIIDLKMSDEEYLELLAQGRLLKQVWYRLVLQTCVA